MSDIIEQCNSEDWLWLAGCKKQQINNMNEEQGRLYGTLCSIIDEVTAAETVIPIQASSEYTILTGCIIY